MTYRVTKTYGHECGLSATFRQKNANSHCRFLHGYALSFKFTFECHDDDLDKNGWVQDFGGLKPLKAWLEETFDHKTLVDEDDPALVIFQAMDREMEGTSIPKLAQLVIVDATGCEAFAKMAYDKAEKMLHDGALERNVGMMVIKRNVRVVEVEVREHGGNSAIYMGDVA